ncbi:hypothetical protein BST27_09195 [Mycobacterium intermedium]|uniref:Secreted protein n=1 Tax=Mycobacterium intermedium TaxID=28445 RepID=A0A1E3SMN2_MYCIE|nr:hypothetical protein [Mycobacterium intermedium]MCV6967054.1 hypothetical protein [Mycobacterium intermedium]ODR03359.1 hypothetical protein BHQ20_00505 [Mycobacterium intermedium]OPE52940.1 hypothetical protein BV508_00200 [Mycobacterium intermedium]ORB07725.1 hypothetical protein BST27_09195 [Mycobacterium intermedium]
MSVLEWVFIAASVVIVVAVVLIAATVIRSRRKTERLKQHYGAEYERLVAETGDHKAAEAELTARERKRHELDLVPLTPAARSEFTSRWHEVQTKFVDNPAAAVGVADRLVTEVMRERGYPIDDFDRRAADISVDHPQVVDNYRAAHGIHVAQQRHGDVSTEQQREAFVHYRALFEKLLETDTDKDAA